MGRAGIYEVIEIDEKMRTEIHEDRSEQEMIKYVRSKTPSIRQDGCERVLAGETTLNEVIRVTSG